MNISDIFYSSHWWTVKIIAGYKIKSVALKANSSSEQ